MSLGVIPEHCKAWGHSYSYQPHIYKREGSLGENGGGLVAKSCLTLATPWTVALQAPLSIGFSRQEYWRGLPFPPPGDLPDPEIEPLSLASPTLAGVFSNTVPPGH